MSSTPSEFIALALNSGSSSLKFGLYRVSASRTDTLFTGVAESIGEPSSRARAGAKFGSQFIVAAPEGQKVPVRLFGRNHARDWPDQMTAANSLQKAHSVKCERPGFQGWPGVTAMPAEPSDGRKVKSRLADAVEALGARVAVIAR